MVAGSLTVHALKQTFTYISVCVVPTVSVDFVNLLLEVLPFWNDEVIFQGFADEDDIVLNTSIKEIKILSHDIQMVLIHVNTI